MNEDHPIAVKGLRDIQSFLRLGTPLEGLRPSEAWPWRFLFVVPSDMATKFRSQRLIEESAGDWVGKVQQYVFGRKSEVSVQRTITSQQGWGQQVRCVHLSLSTADKFGGASIQMMEVDG